MFQRIHDGRHERYIRHLRSKVAASVKAGDRIKSRLYWRLMIDAINARSPSQVARMESAMGLTA